MENTPPQEHTTPLKEALVRTDKVLNRFINGADRELKETEPNKTNGYRYLIELQRQNLTTQDYLKQGSAWNDTRLPTALDTLSRIEYDLGYTAQWWHNEARGDEKPTPAEREKHYQDIEAVNIVINELKKRAPLTTLRLRNQLKKYDEDPYARPDFQQ